MAAKRSVMVETGARIHLGFYGFHRENELTLGGAGIAVEGVGYKLIVSSSSKTTVIGCQAERVMGLVREAAERLGVEASVSVRVEKCIPQHVGLGSTTQLTLAVYSALALYAGLNPAHVLEKIEGSKYSGIGLGAFKHGGFIVDTGSFKGRKPLPVFSLPMPSKWRIITVIPRTSWRMSNEEREEEAVDMTIRIHKERAGPRMDCRGYIALLDYLIPGIIYNNYEAFVRGAELLEEATASSFSPVQEGHYCCRESERAALAMKEIGCRGVGQSSWGPLVYCFAPDEREAKRLADALQELLPSGWHVGVYKPRNRGATVRAGSPNHAH